MIISQIIGGLGNQMFQYARGQALALELGVPHLLDLTAFSGYKANISEGLYRGMALHGGFQFAEIFDCDLHVASDSDIKKIIGWRRKNIFKKRLSNPYLSVFHGDRIIMEKSVFNNERDGLSDKGFYISGYWQNEKYFISQEDEIRKSFIFRAPLVGENSMVAETVRDVNSVSLHIRRGDYVSNKKFSQQYPVASIRYYKDAINIIKKMVPDPVFFIFSDSIEWAKENFDIGCPVSYISNNNGVSSYNDMHLMSLCKHNITANSSFSWWGAWLNDNESKIVISPKNWANHFTFELPKTWIAV